MRVSWGKIKHRRRLLKCLLSGGGQQVGDEGKLSECFREVSREATRTSERENVPGLSVPGVATAHFGERVARFLSAICADIKAFFLKLTLIWLH